MLSLLKTIQNSITSRGSRCNGVSSDFKIAGKTAITRRGISAPLKIAIKLGLISGRTLNFGKGQANHDSAGITATTGQPCFEFDFVHAPLTENLNRTYDCIYAGYVLNVLPPTARKLTIKMIAKVMGENAKAVIAVRSASESALKKLLASATGVEDGIRTKTGTFQKGYTATSLTNELVPYFKTVQIIKSPSGFVVAVCSQQVTQ